MSEMLVAIQTKKKILLSEESLMSERKINQNLILLKELPVPVGDIH